MHLDEDDEDKWIGWATSHHPSSEWPIFYDLKSHHYILGLLKKIIILSLIKILSHLSSDIQMNCRTYCLTFKIPEGVTSHHLFWYNLQFHHPTIGYSTGPSSYYLDESLGQPPILVRSSYNIHMSYRIIIRRT